MNQKQTLVTANQRTFLIALGLIIGGNLLAGILSIPLVSFVVCVVIVVLVTGALIAVVAIVVAPKRLQQRAELIAESVGAIAAAFKRGRGPQA